MSRRVSFDELETLVRRQLKLPERQLPLPKLHALWKVLDENSSGFIDAGDAAKAHPRVAHTLS